MRLTMLIRFAISNIPKMPKQMEKVVEKPIPSSPILGPITVTDLKVSNKTYRWCTCGQSLKQPFCDASHKGTEFKPFRFTVEENIDKMDLCGCKLTNNPPFCDKETCVKLREQQKLK